METFKKIAKIVAIVAAVLAVVIGVYKAVVKLIEKKNAKDADNRENYVSCSCFDGDFISENTVA